LGVAQDHSWPDSQDGDLQAGDMGKFLGGKEMKEPFYTVEDIQKFKTVGKKMGNTRVKDLEEIRDMLYKCINYPKIIKRLEVIIENEKKVK
jgi:hypothetical protein